MNRILQNFFLTLLFIIACNSGLMAQNGNVGISDGGYFTPDSAALLELKSSFKGFLITRLTTTQRNAIPNPPEALMIFNTTTKCLEIYVNAWKSIWCDSCVVPPQPAAIAGNTSVCAGATASYAIASVPGALSYTWTVPAGWVITSGQGTDSISVTAGTTGQNGNITVTAINGCGSSTAQLLAVNVQTNGNVIGIRVTTGFYGNSAGDYSNVDITFNQPYTGVTYVSNCSGACTCSGTGTNFVQQTSGGTCLGTSLNIRDFTFNTIPTAATVQMVGQGVHTYYPRFYWILTGGIIDYTTVIETCNNPNPYIYTTWNETSQCTFISPCP